MLVATFFTVQWALPYAVPLPPITMLLGALLVVGLVWFLGRVRATEGETWRRFAFAVGPLSFFILLAPLQELNVTRPDNTRGMTLAALAFVLLLGWLALRLRSREKSGRELG